MKGGLPGNSFFSCLFLFLLCFGGRGSFPNHTEMALSEGAHTSEMAPSVSLRDALDSDNTTPHQRGWLCSPDGSGFYLAEKNDFKRRPAGQ